MKKILAATILATGLLLVLFLVVWAQPNLTTANSQVTILSDGKLNVRYQLVFLETETRNKITTIGPFDPNHQMTDATLESKGVVSPVSLVSQGGGNYGANFAFTTQPGQTYTVTVRYSVNRALDTTTRSDVIFRVVNWSPIQWSLPLGQEIVTFITPIELPAGVTQPEQVTQAIVSEVGILEDSGVKASFDRWIYYPTPDAPTGKYYLSVYASKNNLAANGKVSVVFYIPARYFSVIAAAPASPPFQPGEANPTDTGISLIVVGSLFLCVVMILGYYLWR